MRRLANCNTFIFILLIGSVLSGCGTAKPATDAFVTAANVSAMVPLANGGLRYANGLTGNIYEVNKSGTGSQIPLARVPLAAVPTGAAGAASVTGLAVDSSDRTFAAWISVDNTLTVGQVAPGPTRVIYRGPQVTLQNLAGRLTTTPYGRILLSVGDLGDPAKVADPQSINGKLLSLDPNGTPTQLPNAISSGFTDPTGVAYSFDNVLWVADDRGTKDGRLARTSDTSATSGAVTNFSPTDKPIGMSAYGEQEMAVCLSGNHELKRYLLSDGIQALPGRTLAMNCAYGVVQLHDGRLAYATTTGIRTTLL